ncbi:unnamed protein product [Heligmosomoides polygyrus]|uniref:Cerebellar degeneration-related antigen 1 n=1 Tax=Heligmosomoides polygyrus TaxID=6339 RepID=A0A183G0K2_HELPZ|nr:unnamed protein product [Heligmosomoides polygyrus]
MVEEERSEVVLLKEEGLRIHRWMEEELGCRSAPLVGCWVVLVELVAPPAVVAVVGEELEGLKEVTVAGILLMVELEQLGEPQAVRWVVVEEEQEALRVEMEELERCKPEVAEAAGILLKMVLVVLEELEDLKVEMTAGILLMVELEELQAVMAVVEVKLEGPLAVMVVEEEELEALKEEIPAGILLMVGQEEPLAVVELGEPPAVKEVGEELEEPPAVMVVEEEELEGLKEETTAGILLMVEMVELEVASGVVEPQEQLVVRNLEERRGIL